ncbi:MAG TPA: FadR/GntR family transcriptional regulator [Dyella sp.]|uniref:FadR/GntR family transcriptional regulator n=1 Tax=Dyella sp. TaxID=1869338 RepID=UPI002C2476E7|nr:FadR/GntR family transcriptional regulator [Dyella sp.]HTV84858.1 FadR/GntR family transcriptional regulator [Dyella sp.]
MASSFRSGKDGGTAQSARPSLARRVRTGVGPMAARNLHGHVVQQLGMRIVSGELKPGTVLPPEANMAEEMDVSRTSLREAMKVLSAKGLVEARPKVGTRVRDARFWNQLDADVLAWRCSSMPTSDFVDKLTEMREIIEPAAAASAARHRTAAQLHRMQSAYDGMEAAPDPEAWTGADLDFHEAILAATGNELLISLFSVIETALSSYFTMSAHTAANFKYSLPQHRAVLLAIKDKQPEVAHKAMLKVIADTRANLGSKRRGRPG